MANHVEVIMQTSLISEKAISLPFRFDSTGNVAKSTDQTHIWADRVRSAVGTISGERVMRSEFGSDIALISFDTVFSIEESVKDKVSALFSTTFPTLVLEDVSVFNNEVTNTVEVTVVYLLPNQERITTQVGVATLTGTLPIYEENR